MSLLMGLDVKGHIVVTYYYFSSLGLYIEFASMPTFIILPFFSLYSITPIVPFSNNCIPLFFSHFQLLKTKFLVINSKLGLLVFYGLPPT